MSRALLYALSALVLVQFIVIIFLPARLRGGGPRTGSEPQGVLHNPLGITAVDGDGKEFFVVVPAGHRLPHTHSESYTTESASQDRVEIAVAQQLQSGMERIAVIDLKVPTRPPGTPQVIVTLKIDADKKLRIKATTIETGTIKEFGPFPVE